jgi:isopentenyldiphosphate isomerase
MFMIRQAFISSSQLRVLNRNRHIMTTTPSAPSTHKAATKRPSILERINALDRSAELSHFYTPFIMLEDSTGRWIAVGNVETSFIKSTLLQCRDDAGDPVFVHGNLTNKDGVTRDALRMKIDLQLQNSELDETQLFEKRTAILDAVTNRLLSMGVIPRKHSDMYPVSPFIEQTNQRKLALVNRSTAPYLGIDSIGVHLHCYVCQNNTPKPTGIWLAKRAPNKSHHPNFWDPTVAGGQPVDLSLYENIIKEAHEEAGVPSEWLKIDNTIQNVAVFTDHTHDPLTITTAKPDGSCMKRSLYYSFDLQVPIEWEPTAVDGEVSEFKLYSMPELEEELRYGDSVRPAMRSVLLDFMIRHQWWKGSEQELEELRRAMRRKRMVLW